MNKMERRFVFDITRKDEGLSILSDVVSGAVMRDTFDKCVAFGEGRTHKPHMVELSVLDKDELIFHAVVENKKEIEEYYYVLVRAWTKFKEDNPGVVGLL